MDGSGDEEALWATARAGDRRAFAALFDRHVERVFRHARRFGAEPTAAEEIASAAFFELWRRRQVVRVVDGSVLPWLLVTATNIGRNADRGVRRQRALLERMPREQPVDVHELAEARSRRAGLQAAIHRLGRVDAGLLTLTALEGYPIAEAAAAVGITAQAARARLVRARRRLRVELQPLAEELS